MTLLAVLSRTSQHPVGAMDYELPVTVEYRWHPATALHDASAEVLGAVDEGGRDVHLTPREEQRVMRLIESYHENPVQSVRA